MEYPTLNIITLGDGEVGKSSLINRISNNSFDIDYRRTMGIDVQKAEIKVDNITIPLAL